MKKEHVNRLLLIIQEIEEENESLKSQVRKLNDELNEIYQ